MGLRNIHDVTSIFEALSIIYSVVTSGTGGIGEANVCEHLHDCHITARQIN